MTNSASPSVCFYFQVHQPYRLRDIRITDVGASGHYFDDEKNRDVFRKVATKCYLPTNTLLLTLLTQNKNFRIAFSLSGVFLDQCREYGPDVLASFQKLAETGQVEFLAETYYHSLSCLFSIEEFCDQVEKHTATIKKLFKVTPTTFRNTELVYSNEIAEVARLLGFRAILAEGADRILDGRSPNVVYTPPKFTLPREWQRIVSHHRIHPTPVKSMKTLLKNYQLSDDIAFRFGAAHRTSSPLTAETFAGWIRDSRGKSVNLFMDYETFGEHQWADTGIFQFLGALPDAFTQYGITINTPAKTAVMYGRGKLPVLDAHAPVSWADTERDLSAWRGNHLQEAALSGIYGLEHAVKKLKNPELLEIWRKLQTSDHFYYLCTKYWADGDVHKYFSPYESPYEAYRRYSHALEDLKLTIAKVTGGQLSVPRTRRAKTHKRTLPLTSH